ncbi:hypothetical protein K4K49_002676 [Colletotrichum sp. SAR 10_70]|nr:hypothetical protein K4K50_001145 [Colletotrichum sp. SAR 10_71]KAI8175118.1 hypothetical protein K4K49_002676 [Colletotrichum sp. SAR 10_70]KAI8192684.1 hypothetical protein K4K51_000170 [Colletotrichum sp. SAR 10_75]KAI8208370.1 hypothetical protein K4K52_001482 [Colletotrichum sp. SAR 10_76]KAI8251468.1 hypothetical protein K4K53_012095 [Colletotrichum sp. SAR 10_77]
METDREDTQTKRGGQGLQDHDTNIVTMERNQSASDQMAKAAEQLKAALSDAAQQQKRKRCDEIGPPDLPSTKIQKRTGPYSEATRGKSETNASEESDVDTNTTASSDQRLNLSIIADDIIPERRGIPLLCVNSEDITRETRNLYYEILCMSEEPLGPDLDIALQLAAINPSAKERKDIMAPFMENLQKEPCLRRFVVRHVIDEEKRSTLETRATEVNMMIAIHKTTGRIPQARNDVLGKSARQKMRTAAWRATATALNGTSTKNAPPSRLYIHFYEIEKQNKDAMGRIQ